MYSLYFWCTVEKQPNGTLTLIKIKLKISYHWGNLNFPGNSETLYLLFRVLVFQFHIIENYVFTHIQYTKLYFVLSVLYHTYGMYYWCIVEKQLTGILILRKIKLKISYHWGNLNFPRNSETLYLLFQVLVFQFHTIENYVFTHIQYTKF